MGGSKDLLHPHLHRLLDRYWGFWRPRPTDLVPTCNYPIISSILKMTRWLRGPTCWGPDGGWEGDGKRGGSPKRFPPPTRGHILYTQLRPPAERYRPAGTCINLLLTSYNYARIISCVPYLSPSTKVNPPHRGRLITRSAGRSPQLAFVPIH